MKTLFYLCLCVFAQAHAAISVVDDAKQTVTLQKPALRVISMAPHITEQLFALGAGEQVVGVISHSDYPAAAKRIPEIGDAMQIDIERVVALRPDLLVVWQTGTPARQIEQLRKLGIPIFMSEPQKLRDIASGMLRLGQLVGKPQVAQQVVAELRQRQDALEQQYAKRPKVSVFYQVWEKPLHTLNGKHIISDIIHLCGGENIFADLAVIAPSVSVEAVLQADPEVIFGGEQSDKGNNSWRKYANLTAVKRGNLFSLNADLLTRAGPRMIEGAADVCDKLEQARRHRGK